jgi:hypothetical protein
VSRIAAAVEQYRADLEEVRSKFAVYTELAPLHPIEQLEDLYLLAGMDAMSLPYAQMTAETYLAASGSSLLLAEWMRRVGHRGPLEALMRRMINRA